MKIQLSDHFTYKKILLFALPPISSMVFTSLYGIVDGYFVSNYVGATPFASLNLVMPYCILYLRINMVGVAFFMIQQLFQTFLITAEKPKLGFRITLIAGCSNMLLDWLLVGILRRKIRLSLMRFVLKKIDKG